MQLGRCHLQEALLIFPHPLPSEAQPGTSLALPCVPTLITHLSPQPDCTPKWQRKRVPGL